MKKNIFVGCLVIIACSSILACKDNPVECPESNLHKVSSILSPFARLSNALSLQSSLATDPKINIPHIFAELISLEHSNMDDLLAFDPNSTDFLVKTLRDSSKLAEPNVDGQLAGMDKVGKVQKDFELIEIDPESLTKEYDVIDNLKLCEYFNLFSATHQFEKFQMAVRTTDRTDINSTMVSIPEHLGAIRKDFGRIDTISLNTSAFVGIEQKITLYKEFLGAKHSFSRVSELGAFLTNSKLFENAHSVLRIILRILEAKPSKAIRREYTSAFLLGVSDIEAFRKELPALKSSFAQKQDFEVLQKELEPIFKFAKDVKTGHGAVLKSAASVKSDVTELLEHIRKIIQTPENFESTVDHVTKTLDSLTPEKEKIEEFTRLQKILKETPTFQKSFSDAVKGLLETDDFKWVQEKKDSLKSLGLEILNYRPPDSTSSMTPPPTIDPIDGSEFAEVIKKFESLQKKVQDVEKIAKEFQESILEMSGLRGTVNTLNRRMMQNVQSISEEKIGFGNVRKMILLAKNQYGLDKTKPLEERKMALDQFHTQLKSQIHFIRKSIEKKPEKSKFLDSWKRFPSRKDLEEQIVSGYALFQIFDDVITQQNVLEEVTQKNLEVYAKITDPKIKKKFSNPQNLQKTIQQIQDLNLKITPVTLKNDVYIETLMPKTFEIPNPQIEISHWREANEMLIGTEIDQKLVVDALEFCKTAEYLNLDWSSYQSKLNGEQGDFARFKRFSNRVNRQKRAPRRISESKDFGQPLVFFLIVLIIGITAYTCAPIIHLIYMKKWGNENEKRLELKTVVREEELDVDYEEKNFRSIQEVFEYRKEARAIWHSKADKNEKACRLEFRKLLEEERSKKGNNFGTIIHTIAEKIQQSYIEARGPKRADDERGNYFMNPDGNVSTLTGRLFRCIRNVTHSKEIWQYLTQNKFSVVVDMENYWCEEYKSELQTNIRGNANQPTTVVSKNVEQPFKNLELQMVEKTASGHKFLYMKYRNFPNGFAPFELTPCQVMYELMDQLGKPEDISAACVDRDGDSRSCILQMIDNMMFVMTNGASLEDLYKIGELLANQRRRSIDLVTTAQIEFCLYVCFKIINDESPYDQPMFTNEKTEFLRDLEDGWACSWLRNYEKFQNFWESQKMERIYIPDDRKKHWYPQTKPRMKEIREKVVKFIQRRRSYAKFIGKPDPYGNMKLEADVKK